MVARNPKSERVIQLFKEGRSHAEIALLLDITRSASVGIVHRAGLTNESRNEGVVLTRKQGRPRQAGKVILARKIPPYQPKEKPLPKAPLVPAAPAPHLTPPPAKFHAIPPKAPALTAYENHRGIPLLALKEKQCHWPIGEASPITFCGKPSGGTYCPTHEIVRTRGSAALT
jgi:hypothetical protein